MTVDDYKIVFDPKVEGCLNIHRALRNETLDFFVALSSGCGIIGTPGQSNYAASCTFLDSFAKYRQSLGLHAVSIDLGYVEDIGYASGDFNVQNILAANGAIALSGRNVIEAVEAAIRTVSPPTVESPCQNHDRFTGSQIISGLALLDETMLQTRPWTNDMKFSPLVSRASNEDSSNESPGTGLVATQVASKAVRDAVRRLPTAPRENNQQQHTLKSLVCAALTSKLAQMLSVGTDEIEPNGSTAQYGIDSLMAIELRSWAKSAMLLDVPINDFMSPYSIEDLAGRIGQKTISGGGSG